MAIITIGEMIHITKSQALAALFAPEDMRGRYMAFFRLGWIIPNIFGSFSAGLVMDNFNPNYVWYIAGVLSLIALIGYGYLHNRARGRFEEAKAELIATTADIAPVGE
jgi:MFS family permease